MPDPSKYESKDKFMSACMSKAIGEGKDKNQASAMCNSMWSKKGKKQKESLMQTSAGHTITIKEVDGKKVYTFYAATTIPDRVVDGDVDGEILTKSYLDKVSSLINNKSKLGGKFGAYRTVGLFHDRIYAGDQTLEEAGYILPNSRVVPMKEYPGHYALEVDVEVNDMYQPNEMYPDYTPDKIKYKIDKGALGLSIEYFPSDKEYQKVSMDDGVYRVVDDFAEYAGFSFARANVIGNPTAVLVKESLNYIGGEQMAEEQEAKVKELTGQLEKLQAEVKEMDSLRAKLKEAEQALEKAEEDAKADSEAAVKELQVKIKELEDNSIPAAQVKELLAKSFESIKVDNKVAKTEVKEMNPRIKEIQSAIEKNDWQSHHVATDVFLKENADALYESLRKGIDMEEATTLQVKCVGRGFKIVPTAKTKDIIDSSDMAESTYYQTNAMFADRYVAGITETFLMDDTLLKALPKEQHIGGNDQYQWRIWTEFFTGSSDTAAVNPDVTSVQRNQKDFEKMQTPIKEYRWGVEVSDFTQYHARQAIGDLLGQQIERAAKIVTQSMAADIFKENADGDSAQFLGLEAVADSTGNATLYGKTRTTTNRLKTTTLAETYDTTSEAITVALVREGYEQVLSRGSQLNDIAIVMNPLQVRKLFDSQDNAAATYNSTITHPVTFDAAPPEFGFKRNLMPHIDGIPIIRDYNCNTDDYYVVDLSRDKGFVLVVSKPMGVRGLAKVGTSESAYVNFYGCTVYKSPRNIFMHGGLTT